jgi:hypothetical protein
MEVSKLTFTPGFQEQTNYNVSPKTKGYLRKKKLQEAENNGTLSLCKNRADIGKLLDIPDGIKTQQYVYLALKRGELTETLVGSKNGKKEYEYHFVDRNRKFTLNDVIDKTLEYKAGVPEMEIVMDWNEHTLTVKNITVDAIVAIVKELAK